MVGGSDCESLRESVFGGWGCRGRRVGQSDDNLTLYLGLMMKEKCEGDLLCRVRCSVLIHFLEFAVCTAPLYVGGFCIKWGEIIRVPPRLALPLNSVRYAI